jgi:carbonyl reductase 1
MMAKKVAIVLGSTRGIGLALVEKLARELGNEGTVYLTARKPADGDDAVALLASRGIAVSSTVFDLAEPASPADVATMLKHKHGGVDIVVQNGAYMPRANVDAINDARPMIASNSHGTLRVLRAILPILRENGRLIVVASAFGVLTSMPEHLRNMFDTVKADPQAINAAADRYVDAVEAGRAKEDGWPDWVNTTSKVAQVAVVRAFARQVAANGTLPRGALINAACPGVTLTDATREFMGTVFKPEDAQSPADAAEALAWLATLPAGTTAPYGELVKHRAVIPKVIQRTAADGE